MTVIVLEMSALEAENLDSLVGQFIEVLDAPTRDASEDPAVLRLVPDAYADPEAAREFRDLTQRELLTRRHDDAEVVRATLADAALRASGREGPTDLDVRLDADAQRAWLRTLAAVRLVLATRLGVTDDDDHDDEDPRFGVYDWLGFRLHTLVEAIDGT
jgi:hypothetical protein